MTNDDSCENTHDTKKSITFMSLPRIHISPNVPSFECSRLISPLTFSHSTLSQSTTTRFSWVKMGEEQLSFPLSIRLKIGVSSGKHTPFSTWTIFMAFQTNALCYSALNHETREAKRESSFSLEARRDSPNHFSPQHKSRFWPKFRRPLVDVGYIKPGRELLLLFLWRLLSQL